MRTLRCTQGKGEVLAAPIANTSKEGGRLQQMRTRLGDAQALAAALQEAEQQGRTQLTTRVVCKCHRFKHDLCHHLAMRGVLWPCSIMRNNDAHMGPMISTGVGTQHKWLEAAGAELSDEYRAGAASGFLEQLLGSEGDSEDESGEQEEAAGRQTEPGQGQAEQGSGGQEASGQGGSRGGRQGGDGGRGSGPAGGSSGSGGELQSGGSEAQGAGSAGGRATGGSSGGGSEHAGGGSSSDAGGSETHGAGSAGEGCGGSSAAVVEDIGPTLRRRSRHMEMWSFQKLRYAGSTSNNNSSMRFNTGPQAMGTYYELRSPPGMDLEEVQGGLVAGKSMVLQFHDSFNAAASRMQSRSGGGGVRVLVDAAAMHNEWMQQLASLLLAHTLVHKHASYKVLRRWLVGLATGHGHWAGHSVTLAVVSMSDVPLMVMACLQHRPSIASS